MRITFLTGAGISHESGISTFRDSNGLWENHDVMEVASPRGWKKDPNLVNKFYNARRAQLKEVEPNAAHLAITKLQEHHSVRVVTQNVDDLHERAGNIDVMHLHGKMREVRDEVTGDIYKWEDDLEYKQLSEKGNRLRPNIVWFGEDVPMMEYAARWCKDADLLIVVGTSLEVYPAASLTNYNRTGKVLLFNTETNNLFPASNQFIGPAGETLPKFVDDLLNGNFLNRMPSL